MSDMKRARDAEDQEEDQDKQQDQKRQKVDKGKRKAKKPDKGKLRDISKKRTATFDTDEEEAVVILWLIDHPELYDKKHRQHSCTKVTNKLWADKAADLHMEANVFKTWYQSCRSQFGKVFKKQASSEPTKNLGRRDAWLLRRFDFLKDHIAYRTKTHMQANVEEGDQVQAQDEAQDEVVEGRRAPTAEFTVSSMLSATTVPTDTLVTWGHYLVSAFHDIHPALWPEYQDKCHTQLREYMAKSTIRWAAEEEEKTKAQEDTPYIVAIHEAPGPVAADQESDDDIEDQLVVQETGPLPQLQIAKGPFLRAMEAHHEQCDIFQQMLMQDQPDADALSPSSLTAMLFPASADQGTDPGPSSSTGGT
jgi:hypothetical protein